MKSESKLKWLADKKLQTFSYRVVFESDNPKHNHAIYLNEWKEALKIRDFSIVAAISDKKKNNSISPTNFIKHFSMNWKSLHAYKLLKLIRIYMDKENKDYEEINKKIKKEQDKKLESEKLKKEMEDKQKYEDEARFKELEKIKFLKNSEFLPNINRENMRNFAQYWLKITQNMQALYLNSKPGNILIEEKKFKDSFFV